MKRIAVLRGGPSEEYDVSMLTGNAVLQALRETEQPHKDVVITKKGEWLDAGFVRTPEQALEAVDVVFIALHGAYGEDGQVQRILERLGIPFTGSRALSSAIAFNKELTKNTLKPHGILMPKHRRIDKDELNNIDEEIPNIYKEIGNELFVKPLANGSSLGASKIADANDLKRTLTNLFSLYDQVLIEEFVRGKEVTVAVLNNYRNQDIYSLPVIEVIPPHTDAFYNYENKYNGSTDHICPGRFNYTEKSKLEETASLVHKIIGCQNYSRSDFIIKNGEIYFLEINTLPGMTPNSNFPIAAAAVGLSFNELIKHLIDTACTKC